MKLHQHLMEILFHKRPKNIVRLKIKITAKSKDTEFTIMGIPISIGIDIHLRRFQLKIGHLCMQHSDVYSLQHQL